MSPFERMEQKKGDFTPNEMTIYQFICANPEKIKTTSTSLLAEQCGVSQPALTRFAKNLGYGRYQEFRADMISWLSLQPVQSCGGYYGALQALIAEMGLRYSEETIEELRSWMIRFNRIYACGISKSYQAAELFEILSRKHSCHVHAVRRDFLDELCDYLGDKDLLILFTVSGNADLLRYSTMTTAKIMVVTANPVPSYKEYIDKLIVLPSMSDPESSPVSPILFDILVEMIAQKSPDENAPITALRN